MRVNELPCHIESGRWKRRELCLQNWSHPLSLPYGYNYLYSPWNSPGQNTGVGSLSLLQGIFPTQGLNPGLLHWRQILYQMSHKGSPRILEWVAYPFSSGSSLPRNRTRVSRIVGGFFTNWDMREACSYNYLIIKNIFYIWGSFFLLFFPIFSSILIFDGFQHDHFYFFCPKENQGRKYCSRLDSS